MLIAVYDQTPHLPPIRIHPEITFVFHSRTTPRFLFLASLLLCCLFLFAGLVGADAPDARADVPARKTLKVARTEDFEITGDGSAAVWAKATWEPLVPRGPMAREDKTQVKALYSV